VNIYEEENICICYFATYSLLYIPDR